MFDLAVLAGQEAARKTIPVGTVLTGPGDGGDWLAADGRVLLARSDYPIVAGRISDMLRFGAPVDYFPDTPALMSQKSYIHDAGTEVIGSGYHSGIAVAQALPLFKTVDGITWTQSASPVVTNALTVLGAAKIGNRYVVMGVDPAFTPVLYHGTDFNSLTRFAAPAPTNNGNAVFHGLGPDLAFAASGPGASTMASSIAMVNGAGVTNSATLAEWLTPYNQLVTDGYRWYLTRAATSIYVSNALTGAITLSAVATGSAYNLRIKAAHAIDATYSVLLIEESVSPAYLDVWLINRSTLALTRLSQLSHTWASFVTFLDSIQLPSGDILVATTLGNQGAVCRIAASSPNRIELLSRVDFGLGGSIAPNGARFSASGAYLTWSYAASGSLMINVVEIGKAVMHTELMRSDAVAIVTPNTLRDGNSRQDCAVFCEGSKALHAPGNGSNVLYTLPATHNPTTHMRVPAVRAATDPKMIKVR